MQCMMGCCIIREILTRCIINTFWLLLGLHRQTYNILQCLSAPSTLYFSPLSMQLNHIVLGKIIVDCPEKLVDAQR